MSSSSPSIGSAASLAAHRQLSHLDHERIRKRAFQANIIARHTIQSRHGVYDKYKRGIVPSCLESTSRSVDLIQKSSRGSANQKKKFLCLMPIRITCKHTGTQFGELHGMGTKNPIMYIQFPPSTQSNSSSDGKIGEVRRLKLFGTIVSSPNTYLAIQYSHKRISTSAPPIPMQVKGTFTRMVVFAEWRWVRRN